MPFKPGWKKELKDKKEKEAKAAEEAAVTKPASPIHKAFYIEKINGLWRLNIADVQDDKIISKLVKECDNKAHSLETFKVKFAEAYYFGK